MMTGRIGAVVGRIGAQGDVQAMPGWAEDRASWSRHAMVRLQRGTFLYGVGWGKLHPDERRTWFLHAWPVVVEIGPHAELCPGRRLW